MEYKYIQECFNKALEITKNMMFREEITDEEWEKAVEISNSLYKKGRDVLNSIYYRNVSLLYLAVFDIVARKQNAIKKGTYPVMDITREYADIKALFVLGWSIIKDFALNQEELFDKERQEALLDKSNSHSKFQNDFYDKEVAEFFKVCLGFVEAKQKNLLSKQEKRAV